VSAGERPKEPVDCFFSLPVPSILQKEWCMMDYKQMKELFCRHECEHPQTHLTGGITFSSFGLGNKKDYPWRSRTYIISSNNKAFQSDMGGYSIFGSCLDGEDQCLRLSDLMCEERGGKDGWVVESCFLVGYLLIESSDVGDSTPELFYVRNDAVGSMLSQLADRGELDIERLKEDHFAGKTVYEEGVYSADKDTAFLSGTSEDWFWNIQLVYIYDVLNMTFPDSCPFML